MYVGHCKKEIMLLTRKYFWCTVRNVGFYENGLRGWKQRSLQYCFYCVTGPTYLKSCLLCPFPVRSILIQPLNANIYFCFNAKIALTLFVIMDYFPYQSSHLWYFELLRLKHVVCANYSRTNIVRTKVLKPERASKFPPKSFYHNFVYRSYLS